MKICKAPVILSILVGASAMQILADNSSNNPGNWSQSNPHESANLIAFAPLTEVAESFVVKNEIEQNPRNAIRHLKWFTQPSSLASELLARSNLCEIGRKLSYLMNSTDGVALVNAHEVAIVETIMALLDAIKYLSNDRRPILSPKLREFALEIFRCDNCKSLQIAAMGIVEYAIHDSPQDLDLYGTDIPLSEYYALYLGRLPPYNSHKMAIVNFYNFLVRAERFWAMAKSRNTVCYTEHVSFLRQVLDVGSRCLMHYSTPTQDDLNILRTLISNLMKELYMTLDFPFLYSHDEHINAHTPSYDADSTSSAMIIPVLAERMGQTNDSLKDFAESLSQYAIKCKSTMQVVRSSFEDFPLRKFKMRMIFNNADMLKSIVKCGISSCVELSSEQMAIMNLKDENSTAIISLLDNIDWNSITAFEAFVQADGMNLMRELISGLSGFMMDLLLPTLEQLFERGNRAMQSGGAKINVVVDALPSSLLISKLNFDDMTQKERLQVIIKTYYV